MLEDFCEGFVAMQIPPAPPKELKIELYRWEGKWGPFEIKSVCHECDINEAILKDFQKRFPQKIELVIKPWLNNWLMLLLRHFAWHAPVVIMDGKKISQGVVLPGGKLKELQSKI